MMPSSFRSASYQVLAVGLTHSRLRMDSLLNGLKLQWIRAPNVIRPYANR
jgi:hypothetical protein